MAILVRPLQGLAVLSLFLQATAAHAEPRFLSRQYTRCTSCHVSPTGGGLLSPYGRSLSGELSMTGGQPANADPSAPLTGENAFLWGVLGDTLGPVQLGIELRPSHIRTEVMDQVFSRGIWMNADLIAAVQHNGWTGYAQVGRQPTSPGSRIDSYEYWGGYQAENGFGIRGGRFMPAYGIHFADHTAYNRVAPGFTQYDQVYGVEISRTTDKVLWQATLAPGLAESYGSDSTIPSTVNAVGRVQFDMGASTALVVSGLYRDGQDSTPRVGSGGAAFGFAPLERLSVWTQADALNRSGSGKTALILVNETSYEAVRGLWLSFSPQLRTDDGATPKTVRWEVSADVLPRTHFNVNVSFYRDKTDLGPPVHVWLFQLHCYL